MSMKILSAIIATAGVGEAATVQEITQQGVQLANLSQAAVWATVALVAVIGLIKLYWDKRNDEQDLKSIIKDTTAAIQRNSDTLDKLSTKIDSCPKK